MTTLVSTPHTTGHGGWLLLIIPAGAAVGALFLPAPLQMIVLALALYFGCKIATWMKGPELSAGGSVAYLFLWTGMNSGPFGTNVRHAVASKPGMRWLLWVLAKIVIAVVLLVLVPSMRPPVLAGYAGLFGLVLLFHFGLFDIVAWVWQFRGVAVEPLMKQPVRSTSLVEFWDRRWNSAFHDLASKFLFRPLARRIGPRHASLATFAVSGLVHELVITLPIRSNFGGPTAFFLLQALGLHWQRTPLARRFHLDRGVLGWFYTAGFTAGFTWLLFPPEFVVRVILPLVRPLSF